MPTPHLSEAFPQLQTQTSGVEMQQPMAQMSAPTITFDYAPSTASRNIMDGKSVMDTDALTPPEQRGTSEVHTIEPLYITC